MLLNHLDLQVPDVPATAAFFERYFGLTIHGNRTSPAIIILSDERGFTLVLQRRRRDDEAYPEGFHCGFLVDDAALVRQLRARLRADGVACSDLLENRRGVMVYVRAPGDVTVEIGHRSLPVRRQLL
jgi:catechol 2,3-dioxygenase-like lactoylglutathione lyase family enzyme